MSANQIYEVCCSRLDRESLETLDLLVRVYPDAPREEILLAKTTALIRTAFINILALTGDPFRAEKLFLELAQQIYTRYKDLNEWNPRSQTSQKSAGPTE